MAELAYGIAGSILEKLGSAAYDEISLAWGMETDLKKLKDKTSILQSLLKDAEKKQSRNERLRMWLDRLKDVFNDALDVLDEFECEMLRRQVVKEYDGFGRKVCRFFSRTNPNAFRFSIAHKVKEVGERLDEITRDMAQFQLISAQLNVDEEQRHGSVSRDRMTYSFVKASEVIGRESDKAQIIDLLLGQDGDRVGDDNLSVIPVVGIGGLGKTTLAKLVYNDDKVGTGFDLKLWVCVSFDFDVARLVRDILMAVEKEQDLSNRSIDQLQTSLRRILEGTKFLLVLDDVWNEDRDKWLELREFLSLGAEGSKVIVTTRSTSVSSIMTRAPPHLLKGLSEEDSLSLFFKCAFGDEQLAEQYPRLKNIGKEIVKKCGGVPLALKTLGSLLYSKAEVEWIRVRDNEIWELERENGRIIPALQLSYNTMSPCLKQCFAYCSTFPDDTPMGYIELISIWMALGILQSPNGKMELEDIGELQLEELCALSFFQQENTEEDDEVNAITGLMRSYNMHDLVHDLARSVTYSECSIVKSGDEIVSDSVRHLRIFLNRNSLTLIQKLKKLRSIHIERTSDYDIPKSFLATCIARLRNLRVLDLSEYYFKVLPSSIGSLKHLRYLNLSGNWIIERLPDSICDLQSLQTILLHGCWKLKELPRGIRKLVSLRTLSVTTKQKYFPENGIGRLKSLRTLIIGGCKNLRSLPHDIKYCTTLRTLIIDACEQLELVSKFDEPITDLSLQTLYIMDSSLIKALPQWLKGASHTLKLLLISGCSNFGALPEWLPNLSSLRMLGIGVSVELLALPDGMQHLASLEHLVISHCEQLELASTHGNVVRLSLQRAKISGLPQTTALPQWLQGASNTLKLLRIRSCPKLAVLPEWLPKFSSLKKIEIKECGELVALPKGMHNLTSLTDLEIGDCEQLELASESNEVVQLSLQRFHISKLPQTKSLPEWLQGAAHTIQNLHIEDCQLDALPAWLPDLASLRKLVIKSCPELSSLPEGMSRLTSLTHLEIESPSSAFYERYQPDVGQDWAAIAHIPNIHIGNPQ